MADAEQIFVWISGCTCLKPTRAIILNTLRKFGRLRQRVKYNFFIFDFWHVKMICSRTERGITESTIEYIFWLYRKHWIGDNFPPFRRHGEILKNFADVYRLSLKYSMKNDWAVDSTWSVPFSKPWIGIPVH